MIPAASRASHQGLSVRFLLLSALLLIISFIMINGGLYEIRQNSVISALQLLIDGEPGTDSWKPMRAADEWLKQARDATVYEELFFKQRIKFQYPPSGLLVFSGLDALGISPTDSLLNAVSWFAVLVTTAAVALQAAIMMRGSSRASILLAASLAAFATFTFYPVLKSYGLGQAQTWINAWFAIAVVCWLGDRRFLAGLLVGLICVIKPQFALFALWGLLRRQSSFVAGMMAITVTATGASVALYGLDNHIAYLEVLQFLTAHGESFFANQSINGLLHRLGTGGFLEWRPGAFPAYVPFIYYATILSSAAILVCALFLKPKAQSDHLLDFFTAALSFTIASPVAWDHHYGILPPIFLTLFLKLAALPRSGARTILSAILGAAFIFAANLFPFTYGCDGLGSLIQSYLLISALTVLLVLYQLRWRHDVS